LWHEEKPHENDFTLVGRGARSRAANSPAKSLGENLCQEIR